MSRQFHKLSELYLKNADLKYRKNLGQYFTPRDIREHLLSQLPKIENPKVLDPANGTGEFLLSARNYFKAPELHGWEIDKKLVELSKKVIPSAKILCVDALLREYTETYDFVIGNPPYFEFKPDKEIKRKFRDVIKGRANIFSMFIKIGLEMLKPEGCLAYVIPPSMNNGAYFSNLRQYIMEHANIEYMTILPSSTMFHDALQTVMIMILKKEKNKGRYIFTKNSISIFTLEPKKLSGAFRNKTTLKEQGFKVRTGKVVWNQFKDKLSNKARGTVPLIWAHNITDKGIMLNNSSKKLQYIKMDKYDTGPAIVANRITGAAKRITLKAAVIKPGMKFLGENHVNVIYPPVTSSSEFKKSYTLSRQQYKLLLKISDQINSPETASTLRLITGNTQISRSELECLLPLDI